MFSRLFIAAVLAGIVAGIVLATVQHFRTTPLILAAEVYEEADAAKAAQKTGSEAAAATKAPEAKQEWEPKNGFERTAWSALAGIIVGIGLAMLLAGASLLSGIEITPQNGALWGLVAFAVFTLLPAAGLPPEPPGMPVADLTARQIWWTFTVLAGAGGVALIALVKKPWSAIAGVALIALPHLIGAPEAGEHHTSIPPHLVQSYVANSLFLMAIAWVTVGAALGLTMKNLQPQDA
ncbi:MAG TPA: cobalt transporter [Rhizobiales bacterium]|nr:cobalt transporter [Hyphomicrobiales bacterium]